MVTRRLIANSRNAKLALLLAIPLLLYVGGIVYPLISAICLSLQDWDGLSPTRTWVGVANYAALMHDQRFWDDLANNIRWLLFFLVGPTSLGLGLALLLDGEIKGSRAFRTIFFLPFTITTVGVASIWHWLYKPETGLFSVVFRSLGLRSIEPVWLGDPHVVNYAIMGASLWSTTGFAFLVYCSGLRAIPQEYVEAAMLDGASAWTMLLRIKLPLLWSSSVVILGVAAVDAMRVFDLVWSMTQGGPFHSSSVLAVDMYETSFSRFRMGQGAAIAVCLLVIAMVLIAPYIAYTSARTGKGAE